MNAPHRHGRTALRRATSTTVTTLVLVACAPAAAAWAQAPTVPAVPPQATTAPMPVEQCLRWAYLSTARETHGATDGLSTNALLALEPGPAAWARTVCAAAARTSRPVGAVLASLHPEGATAAAGDAEALRLYGWGSGEAGALGAGGEADQAAPVEVVADQGWTSVAAGLWHTAAIRADGTLWTWGRNDEGELGDGTTVSSDEPIQVGSDHGWASVSVGDNHTVAVRSDGTLWAWGWNGFGQLGDGTTTDRPEPVQVGTRTDWAVTDAGALHTLALTTDGTLWGWGWNGSGQIGDGTTDNRLEPTMVTSATAWATVSAGAYYSAGIKTDGTLWAWGANESSQLGTETGPTQLDPLQVGTDTWWASVSAGGSHTGAVTVDGALWTWGDNAWGQLGDGGYVPASPSPLEVVTDTAWATVSVSEYQHTAALKADGTLWTWGRNDLGQLGDATHDARSEPVQVGTGTWVQVSAGATRVFAVGP